MGNVTHEQVNLLLKLFDLRREAKLRQARAWYVGQFHAGSIEELQQKYPPDSDESTYIRMVTSYWEMCASIVNRGMIDDDLYFESNGEAWLVWEKIKPFVPAWREAFKNPTMLANLEGLAARFEAWREKRAPGSNEAMRKFFQQLAQTRAKAAS